MPPLSRHHNGAILPDTTKSPPHVEDTVGFVLLLGVLLFQQLMASLTFPVAKYGLAEMDPFVYAFFRYTLSGVILVILVRFKKHDRPVDRIDLLKMVGLGVLIIFLNQTTYLYGQSLTAAGHGALLFATTPLWILVLAAIHLKERLTWRRAVGMVIALVGVGIVMTAGAVRIGTEYLLGDLIILVAVVAWAYYTVWGKPLVHKYGAFRTTAYCLASGSLAYFPFGLYRAVGTDYSGVSTVGWLSVVYIAIGTSVIAYGIWYWLLKQMPATRLAVYQNLQPIIATVAAYFMLGEPLTWSFVIGGLITLGGIIMSEV